MKKSKKIAIIIITATVIGLVAVAVYVGINIIPQKKQEKEFAQIKSLFDEVNPENTAETEEGDLLAEARRVNPDIVAWLTIPDSEIDFPIVQCGDNEFYLSHDFEGNSSYMGVPFLDYRNSNDFSDFNSIIYGHNISNKYMFYPLLKFKNQEYFDSHPYGTLTLSDGEYRINFIACAVIESDGFAYNTVFLSDREKEVFLKTVKEKGVCLREFDEEEVIKGRLCTLSTCSYEFDGARTVLIGVIEN